MHPQKGIKMYNCVTFFSKFVAQTYFCVWKLIICQLFVGGWSQNKTENLGKVPKRDGGTPLPNPLFFCTVPLRRHKNFQCFCLLNKGKILGNFPQILLESIPDGSLVGNNWVQILWPDAFVESLRSASLQRSSHQSIFTPNFRYNFLKESIFEGELGRFVVASNLQIILWKLVLGLCWTNLAMQIDSVNIRLCRTMVFCIISYLV